MSENRSSTRRSIIKAAAFMPVLPLLSLRATSTRAQNYAPACVDADDAKDPLRQSLHYTEMSPDANAACAACSFFSGGKNGCGECQIFSGPANARGHCDSWSKKSAA